MLRGKTTFDIQATISLKNARRDRCAQVATQRLNLVYEKNSLNIKITNLIFFFSHVTHYRSFDRSVGYELLTNT